MPAFRFSYPRRATARCGAPPGCGFHNTAKHERTIREYDVTPNGVLVGQPLREFQGILTGAPTFVGAATDLIQKRENSDERA